MPVAVMLPVDGLVKVKCDPEEIVMPVGGTLDLTIKEYEPDAAVAAAPKKLPGIVLFVDVDTNAGRYLWHNANS
jgi:hypothetical protein